MNRKMRVIQLLIMLLSSIILFIFVTIAWFTSVSKTDPIIINTGSLKAECKFYRGLDDDYDGVFAGEYEEITAAHLDFEQAIPGYIYTFKLSIINNGTVDGFLNVKANGIEATVSEVLDYFIIEYNLPIESAHYFNESSNGSLVLFTNYVLESQATFDFVFTIAIDGNLSGNILQGQSLSIDNFIVHLIQVHDLT